MVATLEIDVALLPSDDCLHRCIFLLFSTLGARLLVKVLCENRLCVDINHADFSMLLAIRCRDTSLYIEGRGRGAGVVCTLFAANINHAIRSMLSAVRRHLAALDIEGRCRRAGGMFATLSADLEHTVPGMLLTVRCCLAALDIIAS